MSAYPQFIVDWDTEGVGITHIKQVSYTCMYRYNCNKREDSVQEVNRIGVKEQMDYSCRWRIVQIAFAFTLSVQNWFCMGLYNELV